MGVTQGALQKPKHLTSDVWSVYERCQILGRGGSASVIAAKRKSDEVYFAIKIIPNKVDVLLDDEACILKKLCHPYIVYMLESYWGAEESAIVMELVYGKELVKFVGKNKLSEANIVRLVENMLRAVNYCHQNQVVHLDLKPENFIVCENKEMTIKLIDFGFAIEFDNDKIDYIPKGYSAPYAAPEIHDLDRSFSGQELMQMDMWSMGVLTYVLLFGKFPFKYKSTGIIYPAPVVFPSHYSGPEEAKDFILKLLQKNPSERMTSQQALKHPWIVQRKSQSIKPVYNRLFTESLQNLTRASHLRKAFGRLLAQNLNQKEKEHYSDIFKQINKSGSGSLDMREVQQYIHHSFLRNGDTSEENSIMKVVEAVFEESLSLAKEKVQRSNKWIQKETGIPDVLLSPKGKGFIEKEHFIIMHKIAELSYDKKLMRQTFDNVEKKNKHYVTTKELFYAFKGDFNSQNIKAMVTELDTELDGKLNYEEFEHYMVTEQLPKKQLLKEQSPKFRVIIEQYPKTCFIKNQNFKKRNYKKNDNEVTNNENKKTKKVNGGKTCLIVEGNLVNCMTDYFQSNSMENPLSVTLKNNNTNLLNINTRQRRMSWSASSRETNFRCFASEISELEKSEEDQDYGERDGICHSNSVPATTDYFQPDSEKNHLSVTLKNNNTDFLSEIDEMEKSGEDQDYGKRDEICHSSSIPAIEQVIKVQNRIVREFKKSNKVNEYDHPFVCGLPLTSLPIPALQNFFLS